MFAQFAGACLLILVSQVSAHSVDQSDRCDYKLVESMPEGMAYNGTLSFELAKTHQVFVDMINNAKSSIYVISMYSSLTAQTPELNAHPSAEPGRLVLEALESAARDRHIQVEVLLGNLPNVPSEPADIRRFEEAGIEVKYLDVTKLLGAGVMHSKYLITDEENLYLGSANLDWRAFTHVKEMGISFTHCKSLAGDLSKVAKSLLILAEKPGLLGNMPSELATTINKERPLSLAMDGVPTRVFVSASPRAFQSEGDQRTEELDAIIDMISKAKKFVYISIMRFKSFSYRTYWPDIENAIRAAVYERRVTVKVLVAEWGKIYDQETAFYKSLVAMNTGSDTARLGKVEVKYFKVPADDPFHKSVPFARVKHDKYVVTDGGVYFGTSNWESSYFAKTCGAGITLEPERHSTIIKNMVDIFDRDYHSDYCRSVTL